ncbi:MAG: hypothetical protein N2246_06115 [Candidatus Sumerlaeia bacterium]|nr:hypothetical protein [Candidatus Sumerlaeia bacterium]
MNTDEFEIIIKKNGEIIVKLDGLGEKKVRHYREIFEEAIGPIRQVIDVSNESMPPGSVHLTEIEQTDTREKSKEKLQH